MQKTDAPSIVIRRKKIIQGRHHGGAWKVAYADFVTAMMAFFLLMWLLSATTEDQRQGLADYFSPDIPIFASRSGGDGPFGGSSMFSQDVLAHVETGAVPGDPRQTAAGEGSFAEIEAELLGGSGDAVEANPLLEHIRTRLTDEGLIIEVFDIAESSLFLADSATPNPVLEQLLGMIGRVLAHTANPVAITGHVGAWSAEAWTLSADRGQTARLLLVRDGIDEPRFARVTGKADRSPVTGNPADPRNRRIEITLLRGFDG